MSARLALLALVLLCALCVLPACMSSVGGKAPSSPPETSTKTAATPAAPAEVPRASGAVTAPWDTAAQNREARRQHVYPKGESALGRRLVSSLPDPIPGMKSQESGSGNATSAPPPANSTNSTNTMNSTNTADPTDATNPPPSAWSSECWEVQLMLTSDRNRAVEVREEASRRLNVSCWVRTEGAIYKVRAGGCLTPEGATGLVARVQAEGYPEAFRVKREP